MPTPTHHPPHRLAQVVLAALVALSVAPAGALAGGPPPVAPPPGPEVPGAAPTALLVAAVGAPLRVPGSDWLAHLEYDLLVTNAFGAPVTLTALDVLAPDGTGLLRLEGPALAAATQPLYGGPPTGDVPPSGVVATMVDLAVPPDAVPALLTHRLAYTLPPDAPGGAFIAGRRVDGPDLAVDPRAPVVLAPPLRGEGWFVASACCVADGYVSPHRAGRGAVGGARLVKNETFAVDWVRLRGGRFVEGDGTRNEQHFAFGAEVVAAAAGVVVAVRDGMPEGTPFRLPTDLAGPEAYAGNRVVVQQAPGVFATYAHLQPGSLAVRVGDRVAPGQPLGRVGNTGNSFAPHLHFQLSDGPDLTTSTSLPFVLDRYVSAGAVAPEALLAAFAEPTAAPPLAAAETPRPQAGTYPLLLSVADFP